MLISHNICLHDEGSGISNLVWHNVDQKWNHNRMNTVWIVNKSGHDFSDAERFGELQFLTEGKWSIFDTNNIYRIMSDRLSRSHKSDMILITGLPVMNAIAGSIMGHLHGTLNLLQWSNSEYVLRNIKVDALLAK